MAKTRKPIIENGLEQADGKIVVRPAYVTEVPEVDMSTLNLPTIEGVKMQEYTELAQVGDDLDPERTPTGPLAAVAPEPEGGKKARRQSKLTAQGVENPDGAKPAKAAKPAKVVPPPFQVMQWEHGDLNTVCTLEDLMPLDETGLEDSNIAMREIHPENVELLRLAYRNESNTVPPMRVAWSNREKFVPWDGNHRWSAQAKNLMADLGLDPDAKESAADPRYIESLSKTIVEIQITNEVDGHPISNRDLIELAFTANFEHGLLASTYGRTSYAIWWMKDYVARTGRTYHGIQEDACKRAGVKKSALSKALRRAKDKAESKAKQPVDLTFLPEDDREELDDMTEHDDRNNAELRLAQACKRIIATAKELADLFEDNETAHDYLAQFVKTVVDEEALSDLSDILSIGFEVPEPAAKPETVKA